MSKVKRKQKETKQQKYKQTGKLSDGWETGPSLHQLSFFFWNINFSKTKDTVFPKFQRSHVIGGLTLDASVGKGGKLRGGGRAEDD